jgi:hypothetical protein
MAGERESVREGLGHTNLPLNVRVTMGETGLFDNPTQCAQVVH